MSKYIQGVYSPVNKDKYIGNCNPVYRSHFEQKFFRFFDMNPTVVVWGSESIVIPYYSKVDNKMHKYYIDLIAGIKTNDGTIKKYLVELKPEYYTKPPQPGKKKQSTILYEGLMYQKNLDKWEAAKEFATKKGMEFIILTEKNLKP